MKRTLKATSPHPLDPAPHSAPDDSRHQATESTAKPFLERLAAEFAAELERRLAYAKIATDDSRRGARHLPEAYKKLVSRQLELQRLHDEVKSVLSPGDAEGKPEPAVISLLAHTVAWAARRCGADNLAAATSANMPKYVLVQPTDVRKVLESVSTLEKLWQKGGRRV